jgi:hypothetical protein
METQEISEMLVFKSTFTQLITQEDSEHLFTVKASNLHFCLYFSLKADSARKQNFTIQFNFVCRFAEALQISSSARSYEAGILQILIFLP